ncbi:oxidoreductase [Sphingopyxis sp. EG6]|jgi:2,4-dienoyl-CoA reductase-like NADH-dependent reductase (Old Yellow Enzyme family)|uniref:oxidoreductase n=1 Tax=Sphingopyxis sp. EG6 TaxID=1874061 RepID=UPI000DC62AAA|nr:NADH:flavin oxidoreductase [Sphingopyxis sp. EG6]MEA3264725.1 NADH:flavin oxidoreductase [Pseudomonadota bacterium]BBB08522.1 NADH:flavin oxidoreductase [Sphingopyxis sp. EG6]
MSTTLPPALSSGELGAAAALFSPFDLAGLSLANRAVVSPMTRVSATDEGHATAQMRDYYSAFALGGFGLVITEGIYTDRVYSQGYFNQPGLADDHQTEAWRAVVDGVHASGGKIIAQLMHAGALSQGNPHHALSVGPSAVTPKGAQLTLYRGEGPYQTPFAMTQADINAAVRGFAKAAEHAQAAGFDGVEVHGANGYLLDQFLTEGVNIRTDSYGGPIAARAKLLLQVLDAVRSSVSRGFVVGVRISQGKVNDFEYRWAGREEDAEALFSMLSPHADYIHTTEYEAWRPACSPEGHSLAALAKTHSGLPVIANGGLHDPARASELLAGGADLVSIGRGALASADWPGRVSAGRALPEFDKNMLLPIADLSNADRWRAASIEQR